MRAITCFQRLALTAGCFLFVVSLVGPARAASFTGVSALELKVPLTVQVDYARRYIQDGKPLDFRQVDQWRAYCSVEVRTLATAEQQPQIPPGRYPIRSYYWPKPFPLGALWLKASEDPGPFDLRVEFRLRGDAGSDVIGLRCERTVEATEINPLNLREINQTLTGVAELR